VAGVVNYILRKNYDGFEINSRYTTSLYKATAVDLIGGRSWGSGNIWIGALYEHRTTFTKNNRAYLMDDLRQFGGNDGRYLGTATVPGALGNILVDNIVYGLPATNGRVPTAAEVRALANRPNLADSGDWLWYQPERDRYAATLRVRQEFFDGRGELRLTSIHSKRKSRINEFDNNVTVTIASTSPYYIPGLSRTANAPLSLQYNIHLNNLGAHPNVWNLPVDRSRNTTLDYRFDLTDNWQLSGFYTDGSNNSCGRCGDRGNGVYNQTVTTSFPSEFNPYIVGPQQRYLDRAWGNQFQRTAFTLKDWVGKIDGKLFALPAGEIRIAVGGEVAKSTQMLILDQLNDGVYSIQRPRTTSARTVKSAFAEAYVPLFSPDNAVTGIQRLNVNLAVRYDEYSDFGGTTNPKVGVTYEPFDGLSLRGSWGTSFRAPTLVEVNPGVLEQIGRAQYPNGAGDAKIPVTVPALGTSLVVTRNGSTPGLVPEDAEIFSVGGDYNPSFLTGLRLSVTYYNVKYRNRIEVVPNITQALATPANRTLYDPFIITAPQPTTCVPGNYSTYNPLYVPYLTSPNANATAFAQDCQLVAIVKGGNRNLGELNQDGMDVTVNYQFSTPVGEFSTNLNFAKIFHLEKSFLPTDKPLPQLDKITYQLSRRATARLNWRKDALSASLSATYAGSYINNQTITVNGVKYPDTRIPSYTTYGLNLAYEVPESDENGWANGIRMGISIDNLTDKQPPIVLTGTTGFDRANANPYGRIVAIDLSKKF